MGRIWHIGMAVPELERGMHELGEVFGLAWRPVRVRKMTLKDVSGRSFDVECHVTFSIGGPFAIELWQAIPGTPLAVPPSGSIHHIGYWVDNLAAEENRLTGLGYPTVASSGASLRLSRGPCGLLLEPCDLGIDRPSLRDLFPPGSAHAGVPDLASPV